MATRISKVSSHVVKVGKSLLSYSEFDTLEEAFEFHSEFCDSFEVSSPFQAWDRLPIKAQKWTVIIKI